MPHKSFSVFLARCATDFVILLHIIKQGASNQSCGVKKGEKLCKMSILDFDFLAAKKKKTEQQDLQCKWHRIYTQQSSNKLIY
jgi:hypothetical protein